MRTVKDLLATKSKHKNVIEPTALVITALERLNELNMSYLVVLEGEQFLGVFSERDYTRSVVLKGRSSKDTMVKDVMTTDLPQMRLSDSVEDCMYRMSTHGTRYLLVLNNDRFEGIITIHDILRQVIANKEEVFDHSLTQKLLDSEEGIRFY